jgi:hypothetical protein
LARAAKTYHSQLRNESPSAHPGIAAYLGDHGIMDAKVVEAYQLGVVGKPLQGDERFTGMLAIPYLSPHGIKGIRFRNCAGHPKFAQHRGQQARLYNTAAYFSATDAIGIAEGEIDAIVATELLGIPTIGIPGAEMWTAHKDIWAPVFKNFLKVLVFTDGDPVNPKTGTRPGEEMGKAVGESLGWRVKVVECPEGEDVSSLVAGGRGAELTAKFGDKDRDADGDDNQ